MFSNRDENTVHWLRKSLDGLELTDTRCKGEEVYWTSTSTTRSDGRHQPARTPILKHLDDVNEMGRAHLGAETSWRSTPATFDRVVGQYVTLRNAANVGGSNSCSTVIESMERPSED